MKWIGLRSSQLSGQEWVSECLMSQVTGNCAVWHAPHTPPWFPLSLSALFCPLTPVAEDESKWASPKQWALLPPLVLQIGVPSGHPTLKASFRSWLPVGPRNPFSQTNKHSYSRWISPRHIASFLPSFLLFFVLTFELRILHLLGRCSALRPCSQPFLALVIFQVGSCIFALILSPPT
jgi:hypothetical protein